MSGSTTHRKHEYEVGDLSAKLYSHAKSIGSNWNPVPFRLYEIDGIKRIISALLRGLLQPTNGETTEELAIKLGVPREIIIEAKQVIDEIRSEKVIPQQIQIRPSHLATTGTNEMTPEWYAETTNVPNIEQLKLMAKFLSENIAIRIDAIAEDLKKQENKEPMLTSPTAATSKG